MLKTKIWANFQRIIELFTQNLSQSSKKYGAKIRDPEKKIYSGSRIKTAQNISFKMCISILQSQNTAVAELMSEALEKWYGQR
jgi:hypothetical protein